jgi:hypothetical protein
MDRMWSSTWERPKSSGYRKCEQHASTWSGIQMELLGIDSRDRPRRYYLLLTMTSLIGIPVILPFGQFPRRLGTRPAAGGLQLSRTVIANNSSVCPLAMIFLRFSGGDSFSDRAGATPFIRSVAGPVWSKSYIEVIYTFRVDSFQ